MTRSGTKLTMPVVTSVRPVTSSTLSLSSLQAKLSKSKKAEDDTPAAPESAEEDLLEGGGGANLQQGGDSIEKKIGLSFVLKDGLRFHFDSETCLNCPFLSFFLV